MDARPLLERDEIVALIFALVLVLGFIGIMSYCLLTKTLQHSPIPQSDDPKSNIVNNEEINTSKPI